MRTFFIGGVCLLLALIPVLGGCMIQPVSDVQAPEPGTITVVDAMARPSPMEAGTGAVFLTVLNGLEAPVRFQKAESPAAQTVELHETVNEDGVMKMVHHPEGFEIPAGGNLQLAPGGKHIMLINLVEPLTVGGEVEVTLQFDNGTTLTVTAPIQETMH